MSINLLACFIIAVGCLSNAAVSQEKPNQEPPYSKPPRLEQNFADCFDKDTRRDYEIGGEKGAVQWTAGKLSLNQRAIVRRRLDAGS